MSEPLGIAREIYLRREAFIARLSPATRARVFPTLFPKRINPAPKPALAQRRLVLWEPRRKRMSIAEKAYAARSNAALIVNTCARHWDVPVNMLYDAARLQLYVLPRRASMALMRDLLELSGNGATLDTAPADGDVDGSNELPSRASSATLRRAA